MRLLPIFAIGFGLTAIPAFGQLVGPFNFDSDTQLGNFFASSGGASASVPAGSGFLAVDFVGTNSVPYIGQYKPSSTDPAPGFSGAFTIGLDISTPLNNASFGIYLFDPASPGNNLLAIYNLNYPNGGNVFEQIRFWRDSSITDGGVANQYAAAAISGTNGSFDGNSWISNAGASGATISTTSPFTFYHLDFAYDPNARTLKVSSIEFSATLSIPVGDLITNPGFAVRINDPNITSGNASKIDNLTVIPEPSAGALLALAGMVVGFRRRR